MYMPSGTGPRIRAVTANEAWGAARAKRPTRSTIGRWVARITRSQRIEAPFSIDTS